jgi:predicted membrane-bound spermidine synthase
LKRFSIQILCAVFFFSGAAALVFESLWFRQAGLAFGNGVWASALVLSSFMAGLALGNAFVVRAGERIRRPVRSYAVLEATVALSGAPLVWLLPELGRWLDPLLGALGERPALLNVLRLGVSFGVLLVPATAMGATLPILVKALSERDPNFGAVLGRLYGFNTLGAVLGALASEVFLVAWLGVRGAALAASALYACAALVALAVQRALRAVPAPASAGVVAPSREAGRPSWRAWGLAASSFVAGFLLLAFEVIWFRILRLYLDPNALTFSVLLAVVLSGIGLGGLIAGWILARHPGADRHAAALACLAGAVAVGLYAGLAWVAAPYRTRPPTSVADVLRLSTALMLPVSLLSGVIFPFTGAALGREVGSAVRATGLLAFANTVGGMLGSLAGAFLLLPWLGSERSVFALAASYGGVAALLLSARPLGVPGPRNALRLASGLALAGALLAFPFGAMRDGYLSSAASRYGYPDVSSIAGLREGVGETVMILRTEQAIEPAYHRLVTGAFSMASNNVLDRRYMKLFVYWALAVNPEVEDALLISYGIGSTAKALTDSAGLRRIDVVDLSREILEMSDVAYPDPAEHPLRDPRVHVTVEDGRYFLQTTKRRYDLITSEPPPPKHAGVVNLYTREYFQLIHDRLTEGGVNTYWLPVHLLTWRDTQAIVRAYCEAFPNCSLWAGMAWSWMLAGVREPAREVTEAGFARQWQDLEVAREMQTLGVERPEQIAALFMLDAPGLARLGEGVPPLTDDRPKRLGNDLPGPDDFAQYQRLMSAEETSRAFRESPFIARTLPSALRDRALPYFEFQAMLERSWAVSAGGQQALVERLARVHRIQTGTPLRTLALWNLGSRGDGRTALKRADRALADRDFAAAESLYAEAWKQAPYHQEIPLKLLYAACMNGSLAGFAGRDCGDVLRLRDQPGVLDAYLPTAVHSPGG